MKKLSLKEFKTQFSTQEKDALLDELAGAVLGTCHCCHVEIGDGKDPCV